MIHLGLNMAASVRPETRPLRRSQASCRHGSASKANAPEATSGLVIVVVVVVVVVALLTIQHVVIGRGTRRSMGFHSLSG